MNKKLNKLVTNYPVNLTEEEIENLSATLAPVVAACGGGGGGTGGKIYTGTGYVNVNNTTNQIGLTNEANQKLNEDYVTYVEYSTQIEKFYNKNQVNALLDEKQNELVFEGYDDKIETINGSGFIVNGYVSTATYLMDKNNFNKKINYLSASVSGKEDKLTFEYDEDNKVSAINGSALAGQGGTTYTPGQYINIDSNNEISVTGVVAADEYATYSGDWNNVSNSYKTNSGSFLTNEDLTNYATKTYVDGKDPVLIGDSNITAASSTVDGHTQWNLAVNVTPVVTDTKLVGDNCVTAHTTQTSGEWIVGLEQTAYEAIGSVGGISTDVTTLKNASANWNKVSDKLDTTAAAQTYLEKATYSNASGKWENASNVVATNSANWDAKVDKNDLDDYLTKAQYGTDSATFALKTQLDVYYEKTDTSSKTELSTEFAKYVTTSLLDTVSSTLNDDIEYVSGQVDNKVDKPSTSLKNNYLVLRTDSNGDVSGWCDLQDQSYSKSESQGTFVHRGMLDNGTGGTLTGTGLTGGTVLGVNTDVIQTKLTDEQLSAIGEVSSKLDRADLDDYVPYSATNLAIGDGNDASVYSFAQGWDNSANWNSVTFGTHSTAYSRSLALGENAVAYSHSISIGGGADSHCNSADGQSIAVGNGVSARYRSIAVGSHSTVADTNALSIGGYCVASGTGSVAIGFRNSAYNVFDVGGGQAFGRSLEISGGLAIGYYNATKDAAFVIGNGSGNDDDTVVNRSDSFVIYRDGSVSAAGKISANGVELGAGGGALTLPLNIGNNNTVTSDSIGVIGNNSQAGTKSIVMSYQGATAISNSMSVGDGNYASGNAAAFGWGSTAKDYSFSVGNGVSSTNHSYIFGHGTSTAYSTSNNYSIAVGDSVVADNYSQVFGRGLTFTGNAGNTFGGLAIGGWNKTSGNAIFVAGNGSYSTGTSDAFIIRPNGNTEIYGSLTVDVSSGKNVLAVASAATLIGASRQTSEHYGVDNTALGTTWLGVGSNGMHQGFIKYTDGGDVGALDSNSTIQINIKPENAGLNGEMTITNVNGSTTSQSKVVNVPTASYNNMSSFDNTNGPNYMLRKTASGFDIGAAVINVTSLPQQTEANAYYFVYDV